MLTHPTLYHHGLTGKLPRSPYHRRAWHPEPTGRSARNSDKPVKRMTDLDCLDSFESYRQYRMFPQPSNITPVEFRVNESPHRAADSSSLGIGLNLSSRDARGLSNGVRGSNREV